MKKNNKVIRYDYSKLTEQYDYEDYLHREYYGLFIKNDRLKIDTKRLLKVMPDYFDKRCDFTRNTVYYQPSFKKADDYCANYFVRAIEESRKMWNEQKKMSNQMFEDFKEKELKKKAPNYDYHFQCGIIDHEEWELSNRFEQMKHVVMTQETIEARYTYLKNTLYLETIQQMASHLEHAMMFTMRKKGYNGKKCQRRDIYGFMDGRIGGSEKKIRALPHWNDYDQFYSIFNFVKHNSVDTYENIKKKWPQLLKKTSKGDFIEFPTEHLAVEYLDLTDELIDVMFDPLLEFYHEFCELCYNEKKYHCYWDSDEYFLTIVDRKILDDREMLENPFGLSDVL